MELTNKSIDGGRAFDWGRTSEDYAKFRDIYPPVFYENIAALNLCVNGQSVLDLGTGTGVLPRNMYHYGARWIGIDISDKQIEQARLLSKGLNIDYRVTAAEKTDFPKGTFDVVTACQCFWYFDHEIMHKKLYDLLKSGGSILVLYMAWLPFEDEIAGASEELVLKYNPGWSGAGETVHHIEIPDNYKNGFELVHQDKYKLNLHFTRESWHGRMKACRGVGASLSENETEQWEQEHMEMLQRIAPCEFDVLHYAASVQLKRL